MTSEKTSRMRRRWVWVPSLVSAVLAVALWEAIPHVLSTARAQTAINPKNSPLNAIKDRRDVIGEVAKTNQKLDAILALLKSGKLRVIAEIDLKQPVPAARPAQKPVVRSE